MGKYKPKTKEELQECIQKEIKLHGNEANLNCIDTSMITDMSDLFALKVVRVESTDLIFNTNSFFNGDISEWDVSKVTNMKCMFWYSQFNGDISKWDVSNVEDMSGMFWFSPFNGDISKWDVSNVEDMGGMFDGSPLESCTPAWYRTKQNTNSPIKRENKSEPQMGFVDLGLSVKWATCNIGASKPEEYGNYYAWGEVETKSKYNWATYKHCNGDETTMIKYCTKSDCGDYGKVDNKTLLEKSDDVAYATLDGNWRMPTIAEWSELRTNCLWVWITINGVNGYKVIALNGNFIFLPAAGIREDSESCCVGSNGFYWSSSLFSDSPDDAWSADFESDDFSRQRVVRFYGQSVRPVLGF